MAWEIKPKGNQPWIFTGRTDAGSPILWPPDRKSQLCDGSQRVGYDLATEQQQKLPLAELLWKLEKKKDGAILSIVLRIQWEFNKVYHIGWE